MFNTVPVASKNVLFHKNSFSMKDSYFKQHVINYGWLCLTKKTHSHLDTIRCFQMVDPTTHHGYYDEDEWNTYSKIK